MSVSFGCLFDSVVPEELQNFERSDLAILVPVNTLKSRVWLKPGQRSQYLSLALDTPLSLRDGDE